ncbi:MAG TPA: HAD hydrolase-like protein [Mycobacteriales bacterium]|nr:HAD hydrolase-like protein [Mycobacteriales bacterium]
MTYSLICFDLDGTLTDSGVGVANSVAHAVAALGLPPLSPAQLRSFIGPPLQESFAGLGLPATGVQQAVASYREYFTDTGLYENEVYEGIVPLLTALRDAGSRLAVATSKPTTFARRILDHFALSAYFTQVQGAELDGRRRHKDQVLTEVLTWAELPPRSSAVMVGDRAEDVRGAQRVGIACIGAGWGYAVPGELEAAGAAAIAATPERLRECLLGPTINRPGA